MSDLSKEEEKKLHDAFVKGFVKTCKKKKGSGMRFIPGGIKSWGCKKAAERAWKQNKKNVGDAIKKKKISGVALRW